MDSKTRSYQFALKVIGFVDKLKVDVSSQILAKQLLRAATSVGANIIEAQASASRRDFTNFFSYALKSANETKFWLSLLKDTNKADIQVVNFLINEADSIAKILGSSIITLKGKKSFKY